MTSRLKDAVAPGGTVVLDSEGLAGAIRQDAAVTEWFEAARGEDWRVVTSAATLVEVMHPGLKQAAFRWAMSRIVVVPVTQQIAKSAAELLASAGMHGHGHAIDAMLSATALASDQPAFVLTSDPGDIGALCGPRVTVVPV